MMGNLLDEGKRPNKPHEKFLKMKEVSEALTDIDRANRANIGKALYRQMSSTSNPAEEQETNRKDEYVVKVNRRTRDGVPMDLYREGKHGVHRAYDATQHSGMGKDFAQAKGKSKKWTTKQDEALRRAVKKYDGKNWKQIAEEVPDRTHVQCLQRWKKVIRPGLIKGHWSTEEDAILLQLMSDHSNMGSWSDIAARIPGRTPKQCRERWCLNLNPNINKGSWTREEDKKVIQYQQMLGNKWAEIASRLPGRTENSVKSRYKSLARAEQKLWTVEEDATIIYCKCTHKFRWNNIQKRMPGRTKNAIKLRWKYLVSLNPSLETLDTSNVRDSEAIAKKKASELAKVADRTTPPEDSANIKAEKQELDVDLSRSLSSWLQLDGSLFSQGNNISSLLETPVLLKDAIYPIVAPDGGASPTYQNGNSFNDLRIYAPYHSPPLQRSKNSLETSTSPVLNKTKSGDWQQWQGIPGNGEQKGDTTVIDEALKVLGGGSGKSWKSDGLTSGGGYSSNEGFLLGVSGGSLNPVADYPTPINSSESMDAIMKSLIEPTSASDLMRVKTEDMRIV
mmetsp:Transcript_2978/g.4030  ORF Transcript_2978/g.4030 Transcript_2978/m.4030 type:complete len:563 (+) Transcript_2978:276-1964(+)